MEKILVIEDNREVRENLEEILEVSGYDVISAENGLKGVERAMHDTPDLILCDVMMPELDGFGVLQILSKRPKTSSIPFIFLTAKTESSDFRTGMNLGADDYITKPFEHVQLLEAIELRLQKSARLRQAFETGIMQTKSLIDEELGQKELAKLAQNKETRRWSKKDRIYREGDYPKGVYYVMSGKIKINRENEFGKKYITELFGPGDFFGYYALLKDEAYSDSAVVLEEAELSFIPKDDFFKLLHGNRDFSALLIKHLANDVVEKEEQLIKLAYNSIRKRVADALVHLYHHGTDQSPAVISMLRDDLASIVGTTKESVIRTLSDFKSEGLISIDAGGTITIKELRGLERMPN